jgi:pseudouridine kinase
MLSVGGVGRNIAENLARLGIATSLLTVLGDDSNAGMIRSTCIEANVDLSLSLVGPAATGTYLAVLDIDGELVSAVNDMRSIEWLSVAHLERRISSLAEAKMIVTDCNLDAACLEWLCDFTDRKRIRLLIEPVSVPKAKKLLTFRRSAPVFAITPNCQQLEALTDETDEISALQRLHALGFANVVLHRGRRGAIASTGSERSEISAFPVNHVEDVTGAGDAAVAGLVCGLLSGMGLADAARLGQAAASMKLSSRMSVASMLTRDSVMHIAGF